MREFIEYIVRRLVDHPEAIRLTALDGEKTIVFELRCHAEDLGKVIGKSGKTISAVRVLASTLAAKEGRRALVEVIE